MKKLRGSTLVEVLVAMTIISLVAGLSMVIFFQVSGPASSVDSLLKAQQHTSEILDTVGTDWMRRHKEYWITNKATETHLWIEPLQRDMQRLTLEVLDNQKRVIYQRSRCYYIYDKR